jgi:hypothetical protein
MLDDLGETELLKALKLLDEERREVCVERIPKFMSNYSIGGLSGVGAAEG